jgi:hypothetical protein
MLDNIQCQSNVKTSGYDSQITHIMIRLPKEASVARMEVSEQDATRPLNFH